MRFCRRLICRPSCTWKDNLRNVSLDVALPIFGVPILLILASQSFYCTLIIFSLTPIIIYYLRLNYLRFITRTKFFFSYTCTSVVTLMLVFELSVVPMLEILPEENLVFIICVVCGIIFSRETRKRADDKIKDVLAINLELVNIKDDKCICNICKKQKTFDSIHCKLCHTCVLGKKYHCQWLDCCIGTNNLRWYLSCLFFSTAAFIYGSNLTMTSVCHPFKLIATILLPDDCSDVYYDFEMAICFVSSVYSLLIGLILFIYLIYHLWLILRCCKTKEKSLPNSQSKRKDSSIKCTLKSICCKT